MLKQGELLNNTYEIISEIGQGGAGIIYLANHLRLQKKVVIKKIKENYVGRINERGEADILKKLHHRYLPQVYDFIQMDNQVYTVIDYIDGNDLMQYIKRGKRFQEKQVLLWMRQLCEVLEYLHTRRPPIIHSDIKPSNIMITRDGNICLIDFNISLGDGENKTITGYSRIFASPEQLRQSELLQMGGNNQQVQVDARSDIYSLGASLYLLLSGKSPLAGPKPVTPLKKMGLPYSDYLLSIVQKAMMPNPRDRYQTAADMLGDILHIKTRDREVKGLRIARRLFYGICLIVLVVGIGCTFFGYRERGVESFLRSYKQLTEEAKSDDYEKIVDDAINLLNNKKYEYALKSNAKEKADILYIIANSYFEQESYQNAIGFYEDALELDQTNAEYFRDYAIALARNQDTDKAKTVLEEAVRQDLGQDSIYLVKAEISLAEKKYKKAIQDFKNAIEQTHDDYLKSRGYILCARAYREKGSIDKEIKTLNTAAQEVSAEDLPSVLRAMGAACSRYIAAKGGVEDVSIYTKAAINCYSNLIEGSNATFNDYMNLAILYQYDESYQSAKKVLDKLTEQYPEDYRVYMRLSLLELETQTKKDENLRDYSQAEMYYEQAEEYYASVKNSGKSSETMQQLETKMQEVYDNGWLAAG